MNKDKKKTKQVEHNDIKNIYILKFKVQTDKQDTLSQTYYLSYQD